MARSPSSLRRDQNGSVAVEFALIGPAFLAMFFGVVQIGSGMQNYNALRGVSADVARYAVITRQKGTVVTATILQNYATTKATAAPYGLNSTRFTATVTQPATRVTGATEYSIALTYNVPSFLGFIGIDSIPLTYTQPVFVV
jgi:Flp pilus assembly protein TadG